MYSLRSRNVALKDVSALSQVSRDLNRGKKRQHISLEYESEESKPNEQKQGDQDQDVGHEIREAVKAVKCESADGEIKHPLSMDSVKIKVESGDTSYRACRFSATSLPLAAQVKKPRGIVKLEPVSSEIASPGPPPVVGEHCMNHALVERPGVIVKQEPMTDGFTPQTIPNFFTNDPCMNLPPILPYPGQPFIKTEPSGCSPHVPYSVTGETFPHGMTFPQGFAFADGQFVKPEPVSAIPHYYPAPFQAEHILKGGMDVKTEGAASFADESSPKKSKPGTSRKKTIKMEEESGDTTVWEPPLWKEQLANIVKMREKRDAPVDIEGAHKNAASLDLVTPEVRRYQVLVSLMLSSQTKDHVVAVAMRSLRQHGLTVENILKTPTEEIAKLIHSVGFWKKKAEYIKRTTQILADKFDSDIPTDVKGLVSLPGVGPKMALLVMDVAWDTTSGISVDTHVHRITHRLGWHRKPCTRTEDTRFSLEKWLPRSEWRELNWVLVGFGQQTCHPLRPKCDICLNKEICPAAKIEGPRRGSPAKRSSPSKKGNPVKKEAVIKIEPM